MDFDSLTLGQIKQIKALFGESGPVPDHAYPVGKAVIIRAVTYHYTGQLVRVTAGELVLTDAAWIAVSERWATTLMTGKIQECEPFPDGEVIIPRGAVVDCAIWAHALPREQV